MEKITKYQDYLLKFNIVHHVVYMQELSESALLNGLYKQANQRVPPKKKYWKTQTNFNIL